MKFLKSLICAGLLMATSAFGANVSLMRDTVTDNCPQPVNFTNAFSVGNIYTITTNMDIATVYAAAPAGSELRLAPGIWIITSPITLDKQITIKGVRGQTKIVNNTGASQIFNLGAGATNVYIGDMSLSMNSGSCTAIDIDGGGIRFDGITIEIAIQIYIGLPISVFLQF